jgi:hypothetical protein
MHKLEGNIKMGPKGMGWGDVDWIHLAQGSMAGPCEHGNELSCSVNC